MDPGTRRLPGNEKADLIAEETTGTSTFEICPHISDHFRQLDLN